ncbi:MULTISPECIES: hypothetical protein [Mumia]|uniref:hypothetical protein n=1 Tax=Mumia TaxID=1546255 RepID=UPI001C70D7C4|nr:MULTISPECIES: hypothetical protein [unclassified Mumia]
MSPRPASRLQRVHDDRDERGDVPGWVLIVVMSAGLVAGLTAVAGPQLQSMLESALSSVGG